MKVAFKVDGVMRGLAVLSVVVACSPKVTVSRDDEESGAGAGGEGASETGGAPNGGSSTGGRGGKGGSAGSYAGGGSPTGGFATGGLAGHNYGGSGGFIIYAGQGGTGGDWSISGAGGSAGSPGCPCSRRPGAPISRFCPRGGGVSSTTLVEPTGGDATLAGTASTVGVPFRVRIFSGSLDESTEIVLSELTTAPPEEFFDYSPLYQIEPDDLEFTNGGEISIPWTVADGFVPAHAIYYSDSPDGPFEVMEDSYSNAGFSQATLLRSGYFFVGAPKPPESEDCP